MTSASSSSSTTPEPPTFDYENGVESRLISKWAAITSEPIPTVSFIILAPNTIFIQSRSKGAPTTGLVVGKMFSVQPLPLGPVDRLNYVNCEDWSGIDKLSFTSAQFQVKHLDFLSGDKDTDSSVLSVFQADKRIHEVLKEQ